jgi:hypothetical protein
MYSSLSSGTDHICSRHGLRSSWRSNGRMVSQPTRGTDRRLTASATTNRTVQSGVTLKRITEHHDDNVLSLAFRQQGCGAIPGLSYVPAPNRRYRTEVQSPAPPWKSSARWRQRRKRTCLHARGRGPNSPLALRRLAAAISVGVARPTDLVGNR